MAEESGHEPSLSKNEGGRAQPSFDKRRALVLAERRYAYACAQTHRIPEAVALYRKICEREPDDAEAWFMLGTLSARAGELAAAEAALRRALTVFPGFAQAAFKLGHTLELQGRLHEAEACYLRTVALKPDLAEAHEALGCLYEHRGEGAAAAQHYRCALRLQPARAALHFALGRLLFVAGKPAEAAVIFERALRRDGRSADIAYALAQAYLDLQRYDEALDRVRRAQALRAGFAAAVALEAEILLRKDSRVPRLPPPQLEHFPSADAGSHSAHHVESAASGGMARLEAVAADPALDADRRRLAHFRLGGCYEELGDYDQAIAHFHAANRLKASHFDRAAWAHYIERLIALYASSSIARAPRAGNCSERPLLVVGMPYSGTGLAAEILRGHPNIACAGELADMPALAHAFEATLAALPGDPLMQLGRERYDAYAQAYLGRLAAIAPTAARVVDALPENFLHLGLATLLFPVARVIHCVRDPLDNALACYTGDHDGRLPYAGDLADIAFYYQQYQTLMAHWRASLQTPILEVRYQDMLSHRERIAREMVKFCGLKWHSYPAAARSSGSRAAAPRAPVHLHQEVGRWRHYVPHLGALKQALDGGTAAIAHQ